MIRLLLIVGLSLLGGLSLGAAAWAVERSRAPRGSWDAFYSGRWM